MNASHPLPPEVGLVSTLRQKYPTCLYSELLDAFLLARSILPDGRPDDLEAITSYILEKTFGCTRAGAKAVPVQRPLA